MEAGQEEKIIVFPPVGLLPRVVDDVDLDCLREQGSDERTYLGLEHAAMVAAASVVIGEDRDDADAH
jgi:hypothetical protein